MALVAVERGENEPLSEQSVRKTGSEWGWEAEPDPQLTEAIYRQTLELPEDLAGRLVQHAAQRIELVKQATRRREAAEAALRAVLSDG